MTHPQLKVLVNSFPIDEAVRRALPSGCQVVSANAHGQSKNFATGCIHAQVPNGDLTQYFVKYAAGDTGRSQLEAEFLSLIELQTYVPEHVPEPHAWGRLELATHSEGWFLLLQFVDFREDQLPSPVDTGACVAKLHRSSQLGIRDFGFGAVTYDGMLANGISLEKDWITCFTKMLDTAFDHDWIANGPWLELEIALKQVRQVVIPRLLGMLEAEGRRILPSFIHGDLWEGNIGTERSTGRLFIFDSNGYYAHHEMELGMWATEHHQMTSPRYLEEYSKHMQPSEPANEFEDRVRLYSLKNYLMYSANHHLQCTRQRLDLQCLHSDLLKAADKDRSALEEMTYLIRKYASPT